MEERRIVPIPVDVDLVDELDTSSGWLVGQINDAIRELIEDRRRHQRGLQELLDYLDERDGPLGPEDEPEIQRLMQIMQGLDRRAG